MTFARTSTLFATLLVLVSVRPAAAEVIDLSVRLDPECAGADSTGKGSGLLWLDTDAGVLTYDIAFTTDWPVQYSHIHGPVGDVCGGPPSGLILYWFPTTTSPFVGSTAGDITISPQEVRDLIAGRYYINIHTTTYVDGEIRGYIVLSQKNRYLTWHPSLVDDPRLTAGSNLGLRVTIVSLPAYPAAEGRTLWVGLPSPYPEEDTSAPGRTFAGATLVCTPHLQDWSGFGSIHITGGEIMPKAIYQIDLYDPTCGDVNDPACFFGTHLEQTARFGDIVPPFAVRAGDIQPDFRDISAEVKKFVAAPGAPIKAAAHLVPNTPDSSKAIDFKTIATAVTAFLGTAYSDVASISGPCTCPSGVACGLACTVSSDCGGGLCLDGECADQCGRCSGP